MITILGVVAAIVACVLAVIIPIVSFSMAMQSPPPLRPKRFWVLWGVGGDLLMVGIAVLLLLGVVPWLAGLAPSVREMIIAGACLIVFLGGIVISIGAMISNGARRNSQA